MDILLDEALDICEQQGRHVTQQQLERLVKHAEKDRWYVAFGSDVAANELTTAGFWLLQKLLAKR